jgi:hypothetical protein
MFLNLQYPETFLLIGLCVSIWVALIYSNMKLSHLKEIAKKMRIWRFSLLIFAIFWFLDVFIRSGLPEDIGALKIPFLFFICLGFGLGFATGRTQLPLSILIPIYLIQYSLSIMSLMDFVFLYSATFLGYLITPIHPCVSYSVDYLKTKYKGAFKYLALPTLICMGILLVSYGIFTVIEKKIG